MKLGRGVRENGAGEFWGGGRTTGKKWNTNLNGMEGGEEQSVKERQWIRQELVC